MTTRTQPESPAAREPAEPPEAARPTVSFQADDAMVRGLLEAAPDAIVIVRPDGHIVLVNAQTERMFGYRRDELLGQRVEILLPERFRAAHVGQRAGYHAAPHTRPMGERRDLRAQRKGGSEFPAEISLSPLPTRAGQQEAEVPPAVAPGTQVRGAAQLAAGQGSPAKAPGPPPAGLRRSPARK